MGSSNVFSFIPKTKNSEEPQVELLYVNFKNGRGEELFGLVPPSVQTGADEKRVPYTSEVKSKRPSHTGSGARSTPFEV